MSGKDDPDAGTQTATAQLVRDFEHVHAYVLEVIEGPDVGSRFVLDASQPCRALIGTSAACDMRLSDPRVSRRHVALELVGRRIRLRDLESTNGTFVDGVASLDVLLRGGEHVRIGGTAILVQPDTSAAHPKLTGAVRFGDVLGASSVMRRLYPLCERLAATDVPVVIEGETGTGKEQLARALHLHGPRSTQPFVVFDCTAVAPSLIESELFGHERGAFTGSVASRRGVFQRADGGTLLIDEIGDLPLELQAKLLRASERSEITPVGSDRSLHVNVRLLAATRRDLDHEVQLGRFREDLFHRIAVTRIELPPLRDREGDIRLLARHFWHELGGRVDQLPIDVLRRWEDHNWPGNVRELRNAVARHLAIGDLSDSDAGDSTLPPPLGAIANHGDTVGRILALELPLADARQRAIDEFEQRYIEYMIERHGGDTARAAAAAGVARRHVQRIRAKHRDPEE